MTWLLSLVPALAIALAVVGLSLFVDWAARRSNLGPLSNDRLLLQITLAAIALFGTFTVVVALPLDSETRGQVLGLIGVVLSAMIALSSTTLLGNAMAGVMLRIVGNFRAGDYIDVGGHFGRVSERGLFHVEIQTEDRDLTTLPCAYLVTNPVKVVRASGTVVSAKLSLGYDVDHATAERLLGEAAVAAELDEPFVWVAELGDFSVTYRVAGFLTDVDGLLGRRSRLRAAILDTLHGAGIEIVSPGFMNQRPLADGERMIPARAAPSVAEGAAGDASVEEKLFDKAEEAKAEEEREAATAAASDPSDR